MERTVHKSEIIRVQVQILSSAYSSDVGLSGGEPSSAMVSIPSWKNWITSNWFNWTDPSSESTSVLHQCCIGGFFILGINGAIEFNNSIEFLEFWTVANGSRGGACAAPASSRRWSRRWLCGETCGDPRITIGHKSGRGYLSQLGDMGW